jgi:hypothetical protein
MLLAGLSVQNFCSAVQCSMLSKAIIDSIARAPEVITFQAPSTRSSSAACYCMSLL